MEPLGTRVLRRNPRHKEDHSARLAADNSALQTTSLGGRRRCRSCCPDASVPVACRRQVQLLLASTAPRRRSPACSNAGVSRSTEIAGGISRHSDAHNRDDEGRSGRQVWTMLRIRGVVGCGSRPATAAFLEFHSNAFGRQQLTTSTAGAHRRGPPC